MSKLTTKEEIMNQPIGSTLFYTNPYSAVDQRRVEVTKIVIEQFTERWVVSESTPCELTGFTYKETSHYTDLLRSPKGVFTTLEEANEELKRIHQGKYAGVVQTHHNWCDTYILGWGE